MGEGFTMTSGFGIVILAVFALGIIFLGRSLREERLRKLRLASLMSQHNGQNEEYGKTYARRLWQKLLSPESLTAMAVGILFAFVSILFGLGLWGLVLAVLGGVLGYFVMRYLRLQKLRRAFADRFPDAIDNLTRAVQAGIPVEKALSAIGENYEGELGIRFSRLCRHLELGTPFREAAATFSDSLNMPDVDFFCAVLSLNRESGSRLSPMLISLRKTLSERRAVARKLRVLTAETRSAANVLSFLPVIVLLIQYFINPQQFNFLLQDPTGRFILGICLGCMILGIIVINRMSRLGGTK